MGSLQKNAFKAISFRRQQQNLRYLCPILSKFEILSREFSRGSNIKFYVNSSSGSRADTCGRTDGRTDMTKVKGSFHDYTKAP